MNQPVSTSPAGAGSSDVLPNAVATEEQETVRDYDIWLVQNTLLSRWIRFWLAPARTVWLNTPVRRLPQALALRPDSRLLDIGCGYGGMLIDLRRRAGITAPMEGLDGSTIMVAGGQREVLARGLQDAIRIRQGLATALPYADASLDVVLCTYVIKHLPDALLQHALKEIDRVLKPGGSVCLWEAAPSRYAFMNVWNLRLLRSGCQGFLRLRTQDELRTVLETTGFTDLRAYGMGSSYYYYPLLPRAGFIAQKPHRERAP